MTAYILPIIIVALVLFATIRRVKVYDTFIDGTRESVDLVVSILPYIITIFIAIELFKASGLSEILANALEKPLRAVGIPKEIAQLIMLVPLSGSGTIALLEDIIKTYGVDSYPARCASIIAGSSETIFYISAVYFSSVKSKKLGYAIPVALLSTLVGTITACALCRIM